MTMSEDQQESSERSSSSWEEEDVIVIDEEEVDEMVSQRTRSASPTDDSTIPSSVAIALNATREWAHRGPNVRTASVTVANEVDSTGLLNETGGSPQVQPESQSLSRNVESTVRETPTHISIPGLKEGRRMDPRAARSVVDRSEASRFRKGVSSELLEPSSQSTSAVAAQKKQLEAATFDFHCYSKDHAVEASALEHQCPVRTVTFPRDEAVFSALRMESEGSGSPSQAEKPAIDDLLNTTFEKFARRREEGLRRSQGAAEPPQLSRHLCDASLFPPAAASLMCLHHRARRCKSPCFLRKMSARKW